MARRQTLRRQIDTSQQAAPLTYAWYYSSNHVRDRAPESQPQPEIATSQVQPEPEAKLPTKRKRMRRPSRTLVLIAAIVVVFGLIFYGPKSHNSVTTTTQTQTQLHYSNAPATGSVTSSECVGNSLGQLVLVSISQRHLWACNGTTVAYNSPVVTGMAMLAADATPTGTYHIYAKQMNLHLTGSDSTGSWNDYVHYWMPFLDNQYGQYGFHDATWRSNSEFGNISPDSRNGSHGCVECPLATAAWLYNWAKVGTTVKIES